MSRTLNILNFTQAVITPIRSEKSNRSTTTEQRSGSERRIHADRRGEVRFGDVIDRRKDKERRT